MRHRIMPTRRHTCAATGQAPVRHRVRLAPATYTDSDRMHPPSPGSMSPNPRARGVHSAGVSWGKEPGEIGGRTARVGSGGGDRAAWFGWRGGLAGGPCAPAPRRARATRRTGRPPPPRAPPAGFAPPPAAGERGEWRSQSLSGAGSARGETAPRSSTRVEPRGAWGAGEGAGSARRRGSVPPVRPPSTLRPVGSPFWNLRNPRGLPHRPRGAHGPAGAAGARAPKARRCPRWRPASPCGIPLLCRGLG